VQSSVALCSWAANVSCGLKPWLLILSEPESSLIARFRLAHLFIDQNILTPFRSGIAALIFFSENPILLVICFSYRKGKGWLSGAAAGGGAQAPTAASLSDYTNTARLQ